MEPDRHDLASSSTPRPAGASRRILLVDDHVDSVKSLSMLMRLWKYDVQAAYDGPSAIELASEFLPEIILLDIGLPGMSGYEVAQQMRARPELHSAFLIAMTGYGQAEDVRRASESGFNHHLVKPVAAEALKQLLDSRCGAP